LRQLVLTFTFLTLSLFISASAIAKPLASKTKIDKVNDFFMSQLLSGEFEAAYSLISAYIGINAAQFEERGKKTAVSMAQIQQTQGKPISFDLLKKQSVGEHFYKVTYLLKYESAALVWSLNYYQPSKGWKLVDVSFNTDINALFE